MLRFLLGSIVLIGLGYLIFFVPIEGKTTSEHVRDVWKSRVMQEKVDIVKRRLGIKSSKSLQKWPAYRERVELQQNVRVGHPLTQMPAGAQKNEEEEHSEQDRKALEGLLKQAVH